MHVHNVKRVEEEMCSRHQFLCLVQLTLRHQLCGVVCLIMPPEQGSILTYVVYVTSTVGI